MERIPDGVIQDALLLMTVAERSTLILRYCNETQFDVGEIAEILEGSVDRPIEQLLNESMEAFINILKTRGYSRTKEDVPTIMRLFDQTYINDLWPGT